MDIDKDKNLDGAKMVAGAIIGMDYRLVVVNDKSYCVNSPTIAQLSGAMYWLSDFGNGKTLQDILRSVGNIGNLAKALSWLINGNDELSEELAQAKIGEVVDAIEVAFSLIDAENFIKLSALVKSARLLIAKPNT